MQMLVDRKMYLLNCGNEVCDFAEMDVLVISSCVTREYNHHNFTCVSITAGFYASVDCGSISLFCF